MGASSARSSVARKVLIGLVGFALLGSLIGVGFVTTGIASQHGGSPSASSVAPGPGVQTTCNISSLNPLVFDSASAPDTLDPAYSFSVPGWAAIQQAYQTLVQYNQSNPTDFYGVLADRWIVSADRLNYTFTLRAGIHFSNGDPVSAYTMWFSLYRALASNGSVQFILSQNFWYPGVTYYSQESDQVNASRYIVNALNTWDFVNPSASELAFMEGSNQSFQVIDASTIALHVGAGYLGPQPYAYLLATLASPVASAVDPVVIQANGGVGDFNAWMAANMMGTGPYQLASYAWASGYDLAPDPNYWGAADAAIEPGNVALRPAASAVRVDIQSDPTIQLNALKSGAAVGISSEVLDAAAINELKADPCVVTRPMDPVYGSTVGGWWVFMDQNVPPFNNLSFRRAVAHAIDYDQIINVAFGGYAHRWVGPVPPGYPYYNPENLTPYTYDVGLAQQYMNESPWPLPTGYPTPLNYVYPDFGSWGTVAVLLQSDLQRIGINLHPVGVTLNDLYYIQSADANGVCVSETAYAGGPFYIGLDFWTSDYVSPDDWTQNNVMSYGAANACMAHYTNATADALALAAATQVDPTVLAQEYSALTRMLYDNATDAWLVVPDQFQAYHPSLRGIVPNPMGQAPEFSLTMNTMYAVPPIRVGASMSPVPVVTNGTATFWNNVTGGTPPYSIAWQMGDGTTVTATGANVTHVYAHAGNYTANVTVRDTYGGYATASVLVRVVSPAPVSHPPPGLPAWVLYAAIGGGLVAVVAILLVYLLVRRRGNRGPPPAPPPPSGP